MSEAAQAARARGAHRSRRLAAANAASRSTSPVGGDKPRRARRARRARVRGRGSARARPDRAARARRSCAARSRSERSRAHRRRAARPSWPRDRARARAPSRISVAPMPSALARGSTASGPSSSAGRRRPASTCHSRTVPTTRRPASSDERQAARRQPAFAQALAGLLEALVAEAGVEQRLARRDIGRTFFTDRQHGRASRRDAENSPRSRGHHGRRGSGNPSHPCALARAWPSGTGRHGEHGRSPRLDATGPVAPGEALRSRSSSAAGSR